jgi:hypothetical protein
MSAHGFLQHVEKRHRAGEVCKLLMIAEISRVIYVGVRLNKSRIADSHGRHRALNDRCLEPYGADPGHNRSSASLDSPLYGCHSQQVGSIARRPSQTAPAASLCGAKALGPGASTPFYLALHFPFVYSPRDGRYPRDRPSESAAHARNTRAYANAYARRAL